MIRLIINNFFLLCVLSIIGLFYFLTCTTAGLAADLILLTHCLPGKLTIQHVEGQLFSAFSLQNVTYQDERYQLQAKKIALAWHPLALLQTDFSLRSLKIENATLMVQPPRLTTAQAPTQNSFTFLQHIKIQQIDLKQVLLKFADTQVTLEGTLGKNWNLTWNAVIPEVAILLPQSQGSLLTTGNIVGPLLTPTLNISLQGKNLIFAQQQIGQAAMQAHLTLQPNLPSTLTVSATQLKIKDTTLKKLNLQLNGYITHAQNKFNLTMTLNKLDFLTAFIPAIRHPQGILQANLQWRGAWAQPEITGTLQLTNGTAHIPTLGITLQNINLQAHTLAPKQINFTGSFRSGKGIAHLQGNTDLSQATLPTKLKLQGSWLNALELAEYHITISPDLTAQLTLQNLHLEGKIFIPTAEITPKNFNTIVTLPHEVVFVGARQKNSLSAFTTTLQLNIKLGEKIHIAYNNLDTDLTGDIQILQTPGTLLNTTGELFAQKGKYNAYGQTLSIKNGRLIYTGGSLTNPGLAILASKKIKRTNIANGTSNFTGSTALPSVYNGEQIITVGVQVAGTLNQPTFTLFSTTPLSQSDILSYLMFGYPQSEVGGHEYGALLSAISSLNPGTPSLRGLTQEIEQKLGFTELNVGSTQVFNPSNANALISTPTVSIGKRLTKDLSLHYSIGLFYPVSILNIRYQLSKKWTLQSETSTIDSGADLLYQIERD